MARCKLHKPICTGEKGDAVFPHQSFWHSEAAAASEPVAVRRNPQIMKTAAALDQITGLQSPAWRPILQRAELSRLHHARHSSWDGVYVCVCVCVSSLSTFPHRHTFVATLLYLQKQNERLAWFTYPRDIRMSCHLQGKKNAIQNSHWFLE